MFAQPSTVALNHLLQQNRWALSRLARFAGKTVRFNISPFSFAWTILPDGSLQIASPASSADVVCNISSSLLPRLMLHDERAHAEISTEGDAALLTEIFFLSRNLRWDTAEDLSLLTGDVIAERIVSAARNTQHHLMTAAGNFSHAAAEYWTEEHPVLTKPRHISTFVCQVDELRDDLARLELRIRHIENTKHP